MISGLPNAEWDRVGHGKTTNHRLCSPNNGENSFDPTYGINSKVLESLAQVS